MGILCKIRLHRPPNGRFTTGGIVSGVINYSIEKPLSIKTITVSLKGNGRLEIEDGFSDGSTFTNDEEYVSIDNNVLKNETVIPNGSYEVPFKFILPEDIPATLHYGHGTVTCHIVYSVCIHFALPGLLTFDKRFQQEIVVVRNKVSYPRYPTEMIIYGDRKQLFHLVKNNFISLKVKMFNSFITPGGTVNLEYEISNNSDLQLRGLKAKMQEMYICRLKRTEEKRYHDIPNTGVQSELLEGKKSETKHLSFNVPQDAVSFECSKIICKDYVIVFTVEISGPHKNLTLTVPFQVGYKPDEVNAEDILEADDVSDEPPSYWEAMGEYNGKGE